MKVNARRSVHFVVASLLASSFMVAHAGTFDRNSVSAARVSADTNPALLAAQILARWEPIAQAAGMDAGLWHEQFATQLSLMSTTALQRLDAIVPKADASVRAGYADFAQAFRSAMMNAYVESRAGRGKLKLGSPATDQVFVPITPCRVIDTRNLGGPISAASSANYYFWASSTSFSWSSQGGAAGGAGAACPGTVNPGGAGFPSAAMATITVVSPSAAGNFVTWGGESPVPLTSVLNWRNAGDVAANTTVIPAGGRSGTGPGGPILDFSVFYNGSSGSAQVVVDIVGYFVENQQTALDCLSVVSATTALNAGASASLDASCTAGYTLTGGGCQTNNVAGPTAATLSYSGPEGFTSTVAWLCSLYNNTGATLSVQAVAMCCRVPGQ